MVRVIRVLRIARNTDWVAFRDTLRMNISREGELDKVLRLEDWKANSLRHQRQD